ncbi:hypothetical protein C1646_755865 [Rhizophagus diaphanus]|nr:hypothetical protein C1646_755865 [Rhizophagus diaphanus] [Rhizophagus sp. MUCL 43196]
MVYYIFKNIVLHTNFKNIELDLLKWYTTLQSIQYLVDGEIDPQNLQSSVELEFTVSQNSDNLFKDWFIMKNSEMDNKKLEVTIKEVDYGKSYAVIKGIFKHKSNDGYYYPFIYVDWFEDTYKKHNKLDYHDDYYRPIRVCNDVKLWDNQGPIILSVTVDQ